MKTQINSSELNSNHPLAQPSKFRYLPLVILGLLLLNLFSSCNNSRLLNLAIKHKPYIYIQTPEGKTIQGQPVEPWQREETVIAHFTETWLKTAFSWQNTPEKGAYVNEQGVDFPNQFHAASIAIKPGYREAFLSITAQKYQKKFPFSKYISGQYQSYVRVFEQPIIIPVKGEQGVWDVKIVATRTHAAARSILGHEIFNRIIRVRAIKPSDEQYLWGQEETYLGKLLHNLQKQGLQIIEITEF